MVISFVEIMKDLYPNITEVKIVVENTIVLITDINFDKKAVSHRIVKHLSIEAHT